MLTSISCENCTNQAIGVEARCLCEYNNCNNGSECGSSKIIQFYKCGCGWRSADTREYEDYIEKHIPG